MIQLISRRGMLYLIGMLLISNLFAQTDSLQIGDVLPKIKITGFRTMESHSTTEVFSFDGRPTILDFWSVWCASCIKALPGLDSLQQVFGDSLQIISITQNTKEEVQKTLQRFGFWPRHLRIIYQDTTFNQLFPHVSEPFHVWLDKNSVVRHITGGYNATFEHMLSFLRGESLHLSETRNNDTLGIGRPVGFPVQAALFPYVHSYSLFFKGMEEQTDKNGFFLKPLPEDSSKLLLQFFNQPLYKIYAIAYSSDLFEFDLRFLHLLPIAQILLTTRDSSRFFLPKDGNLRDAWRKRFLVSYEAVQSGSSTKKIVQRLRSDLEQEFPYKATLEKRKMKALVLRTKPGKVMYNSYACLSPKVMVTDNSYIVRNTTLQASLVQDLRRGQLYGKYPIVDETGFNEPVSFQLSCTPDASIEILQHCLPSIGIELSIEERFINVLVIQDFSL